MPKTEEELGIINVPLNFSFLLLSLFLLGKKTKFSHGQKAIYFKKFYKCTKYKIHKLHRKTFMETSSQFCKKFLVIIPHKRNMLQIFY